MSSEQITAAYKALADGDPEPLVSLMSEDMIWRGRRNAWRFWEPTPS